MTTQKLDLPIISAIPDNAAGAAHKVFPGAAYPVRTLAFDAGAVNESVYWLFKAANYGSGNPVLKLQWYADSANTGDVIFAAQISCITPNVDTGTEGDMELATFAAAATVTDAHMGTLGQRLHECSITITALDGLAADDFVALKLYRDSNSASDTMSGDALLVNAELTYSDT